MNGVRFWSKVARVGECLEWTAYRNKDGYGSFAVNRRNLRAHRVAWALRHGPVPSGMEVRHKCDNPPCVNPDHLEIGTHLDNMRDREARGRNGWTKLTREQVDELRSLPFGSKGIKEMAERFGIGYTHARQLRMASNPLWRDS